MRKTLFALPAVALAGLALITAPLGAAVDTKDSAAVAAGRYAVDGTHTSVLAKTNHLGFSLTTLRFDTITGWLNWDPAKPEASSTDISIDTTTLLSGFGPRDGHMKGPNWLNVEAFPKATFKASRLEKTGDGTANLPGELTLLGVTKPVTLAVTFRGAGKGMDGKPRLGFSGSATIKRSDFGMKTFLGPIADDVALEVEAEFAQ